MQSDLSRFAQPPTAGLQTGQAGVEALLDAAAASRRPLDRPISARPAPLPKRELRERLRGPLLASFPLLLAAAGVAYFFAQAPYASTDDANVRAAKEALNARVAGQVVEIDVRNNQAVHKGQVLFRIDPAPYQLAVAQAAAELDNARLQIAALKATYRQQQADLLAAKEAMGFDARDEARDNTLAAAGAAPRVLFDRAGTDLRISQQHVASLEQQIAGTAAALNGDPNIDIDSHPLVRAAAARLGRAKLDLSYATVTAPADGIVTGEDELQSGDFVEPGTPVFWLLSDQHLWIEANFRETDLTHMRPGEKATIYFDTYPGLPFQAHVVSMSPGTGSDFALLPPENATGNWVKVVQRLPVRLELDANNPKLPLYSGISAAVQVDTGYHHSWEHPFQSAFAGELGQ